MTGRTGKLLLLLALLGLWGLILLLRQPAVAPVGPDTPRARPVPPRAPAAQGGGLPRLKVELLRLPRPAYSQGTENIFGTPPPPPPPVEVARVAPPPAPPPPPPPDPFQEEAKRLRYVGFLQTGGAMTAFIVQGQEVHTLAVGETLDGRFRVQEVMEDAVVLASPDGAQQVRLSLAGEAGPPGRR